MNNFISFTSVNPDRQILDYSIQKQSLLLLEQSIKHCVADASDESWQIQKIAIGIQDAYTRSLVFSSSGGGKNRILIGGDFFAKVPPGTVAKTSVKKLPIAPSPPPKEEEEREEEEEATSTRTTSTRPPGSHLIAKTEYSDEKRWKDFVKKQDEVETLESLRKMFSTKVPDRYQDAGLMAKGVTTLARWCGLHEGSQKAFFVWNRIKKALEKS